MQDIFETPITYLKGVGPKKAEVLKTELGIEVFNDLLHYFPFRYIDKSHIYKVKDVTTDTIYFQLKGKITNLIPVGQKRMKYITATFSDDTGHIGLVWFKGLRWIKNRFSPEKEYLLFGKPSVFKNHYNFVHPEVEDVVEGEEDEVAGQRLEGVYSSTEKLKNNGLGTRGISKLTRRLLNKVADHIQEILPGYLLQSQQLIGRKQAVVNIHFPENPKMIEQATRRLKFDELFFLQLQLITGKQALKEKIKGHLFQKSEKT